MIMLGQTQTACRERLATASAAPRAALFALCLAVIGAAGWALTQELAVHRVLAGTTTNRIAALTQPRDASLRPLSARSARNLVMACAQIYQQAPALRADASLRHRVAASCNQIAQDILSSAPTHPRALAMALLTARFDAAALQIAQTAAPHEPGALRLRLWALGEPPPLDAAMLQVAADDISRALHTDWGRRLLAPLYLAQEDLRPVILVRAQTLDARSQRAFLAHVADEANGGRAVRFPHD